MRDRFPDFLLRVFIHSMLIDLSDEPLICKIRMRPLTAEGMSMDDLLWANHKPIVFVTDSNADC